MQTMLLILIVNKFRNFFSWDKNQYEENLNHAVFLESHRCYASVYLI